MTNLQKESDKRWGKKFIDERDWSRYNEELVKRGEYFLALDFVENWDNELAEMNSHKKGAPFKFPKSMIELQSIWHVKQMPYRMIEGLTRDLVKLGGLPEYNTYSTVNRRVNKLEFRLALPHGESITVFSDGTGLQAINGGEYLREKYGKKNRRWIQIVMLGDAEEHEPVSYEIHIIPESESKSTKTQIKTLHTKNIKILGAGGDGGLDSKDLWDFLEQKNIKSLIKPDKNG